MYVSEGRPSHLQPFLYRSLAFLREAPFEDSSISLSISNVRGEGKSRGRRTDDLSLLRVRDRGLVRLLGAFTRAHQSQS